MGIFDFFKRKPEPQPAQKAEPKPEVVSAPTLPDSDIMLLEYCTYGSYPNPKNGYPLMWERKFGISDVDQALRSLESKGYIEFCPALDMLPKFTVAQLKDIAVRNGITVKGKKADILSVVSQIPVDALEQTVDERKYRVTEKGRKVLDDNESVVFAYKNPWIGISVDELKALSAKEKDVSARDLVWAEFNRRCYYLPLSGAWREYRQVRYAMYQFLKQERRHLSYTSHVYLAEVMYLDLNDRSPLIAPAVVTDIQDVAAANSQSQNELFEYVKARLSAFPAPCNNFSWLDVSGIYVALAFRSYDAACAALSRCPDSSLTHECSQESCSTRVHNLDTGEWEIVPEMSDAVRLVREVLYIQKFVVPE
jgi:hypothetical protein